MGTIAEKLNYLNTTKTNIKNAIIEKGVEVGDNDTFRSYASKIADIEPTLGTKTITANGTYTASDDSLQGYSSVTVDIDDTDLYRDTTDSTYESVKTLSNCGAFPMLSLTAEINAVQDLHGYDHPWVGGGGKNKLPMTVDGIKTANTSGTWSGNVYSINNGTFTILTDSNENVIGIKVNGTFSTSTVLNMDSKVLSGNYILNGCPSGGGSNTYRLDLRRTNGGDVYIDSGSGVEVNGINESVYGAIRIQSGYSASNITFYPMLRLSTETDSTFAPYSNICPITGWDSIDVCQSGTDTSNPTTHTTALSTTCYGGSKDIKGNEIHNRGHKLVSELSLNVGNYYGVKLVYATISDANGNGDYNTAVTNATTSMLGRITRNGIYNGVTGFTLEGTTFYAEDNTISNDLSNTEYLQAFKSIYDNAQIVYELATPTTATSDAIDLTLAEGVNNIWADSGNVGDARYFKKVEL